MTTAFDGRCLSLHDCQDAVFAELDFEPQFHSFSTTVGPLRARSFSSSVTPRFLGARPSPYRPYSFCFNIGVPDGCMAFLAYQASPFRSPPNTKPPPPRPPPPQIHRSFPFFFCLSLGVPARWAYSFEFPIFPMPPLTKFMRFPMWRRA